MNVVLEHIKDMQYLPEEKQPHQHQTVAEIQAAVAAQRPQGAGEKKQGHQGQHQREGVEALKLGHGAVGRRHRPGRQDVERPDQGRETDEQGQVGDVVDDAVFDNHRPAAPLTAQ